MALLDGKFVKSEEIDPAKHRFIGTFRQPQPPDGSGCYAVICTCHAPLHTAGAVREHWMQGHFDVPQYITVEKETPCPAT
jgi:hypothetical protein